MHLSPSMTKGDCRGRGMYRQPSIGFQLLKLGRGSLPCTDLTFSLESPNIVNVPHPKETCPIWKKILSTVGAESRIELETSCTLSKYHTTRLYAQSRREHAYDGLADGGANHSGMAGGCRSNCWLFRLRSYSLSLFY